MSEAELAEILLEPCKYCRDGSRVCWGCQKTCVADPCEHCGRKKGSSDGE